MPGEIFLYASDSSTNLLPLHQAVHNGNFPLVKVLLRIGFDVNLKDGNGNTAVMIACKKRNYRLVKFLVNNGADINITDQYGCTCLDIAVNESEEKIARYLVERDAKWGFNHAIRMTFTHHTVIYDLIERAKLALDLGFPVDTLDSWGRSILHWAARNGNEELIDLLLSKGADTEIKDEDYKRPVDLAMKCGHKSIVKKLLKRGR